MMPSNRSQPGFHWTGYEEGDPEWHALIGSLSPRQFVWVLLYDHTLIQPFNAPPRLTQVPGSMQDRLSVLNGCVEFGATQWKPNDHQPTTRST
jgi:hypothetical protein